MAAGRTNRVVERHAGVEMAGRVELMRLGDVDVLVETVPVAGLERTSAVDKAADQVVDVLERARSVVRAVAVSVAGVIEDVTAARVVRPDQMAVELGLGFTAKGNVIVVGGEATASLKITLTYQAPSPPAASVAAPAASPAATSAE